MHRVPQGIQHVLQLAGAHHSSASERSQIRLQVRMNERLAEDSSTRGLFAFPPRYGCGKAYNDDGSLYSHERKEHGRQATNAIPRLAGSEAPTPPGANLL